jgi:hypothetical protein
MAKNPCKISFKNTKGEAPVEYSYDEFMQILKDGKLMDLINNGTLDEGRMRGENPFIAFEPEPVKRADLKSLAGKGRALKTLLARAFVGTTDERLAESLRKTGLDRDIQSITDARARAEKFVEDVGFEAAYNAVLERKMNDGVAAYVYANLIDRLEMAKLTSMDDSGMTPQEFVEAQNELYSLQTKMMNEFSAVATAYGQFTNALKDIYRNSLFNYSLDKQINDYKKANFNYISPEIEEKYRKLDESIKELNVRIAEMEKRAKEAEDARNLAEIAKAAAEDKLANIDIKDTANDAAAEVLKFKEKSVSFKDSKGNALSIPKGSWAKIVDAAANAVKNLKSKPSLISKASLSGAASNAALNAALDAVRAEPWFQALPDADKKAVEAQVRAQFQSTTPGKISIPSNIIRESVESGVATMDELVQDIKSRIQEKYPNATDRQIRDAISGYGRERAMTQTDIQREIARLRNIGRMESRLEDIQAGKIKAKKPSERAKLTEKEKQLTQEIQDAYEEAGIGDAQRLINAKENAKKRIAELERRLDERDFSKQERKKVKEDEELNELRAERQTLQNQYDKELDKIKKQNSPTKVWDGLGAFWEIARLLQATFDLSMVLVQGLKLTVSHPLYAIRGFNKAYEHFKSESRARKWGEFIKAQPYYETMMKSGLSLSEYDASLSEKEEGFLGGVGNSMWDYLALPFKMFGNAAYTRVTLANPFKAFERAGIGYLNTMRVLRFEDGATMLRDKYGKTFETDPDSYKQVANMVNTFTGRSSLGPLEKNAGLLSKIFYSPKNWASQLKTSTVGFPIFLLTLKDKGTFYPSVAQKMAARDFITWFVVTTGIVSTIAFKANEDDEDEVEVDLNPLSSRFGKIRMGDIYIDPWGGFIQHIVLQARLYNDALVRGGEEKKLGDYNTPTRGGLIAEFARNKLHPTASLLVNYLTTHEEDGKRVNAYGEDFILTDQIQERVTPMIASTLFEIFEEEPNLKGAFLSAYAFLGAGINVYKDKKVTPKYDNPETAGVIKEFKPKGISDIKKDTFAVPLSDDELVQLNVNYRKKAATLLDTYSATKPSLDDKKKFPANFEKVTDNQLEQARAEAIKKGVPEDKLDEESKKMAIEKKKKEKISDEIGDLAKLAQNAAAYEYFKALGKRIPPTIEEAVADYEKKLKQLQKETSK